jgi:hypothetical protein
MTWSDDENQHYLLVNGKIEHVLPTDGRKLSVCFAKPEFYGALAEVAAKKRLRKDLMTTWCHNFVRCMVST